MSSAEVLESCRALHTARREIEIDWELRFTVDDVRHEVRVMLCDARRFAAQGDDPSRAVTIAVMAGTLRDQERAASAWHTATLGDFAAGIVHWLLARADGDPAAAALDAAYRAVENDSSEPALARELTGVIEGLVEGSIDNAAWVRMRKNPNPHPRPSELVTSRPAADDSITPRSAVSALRSMLERHQDKLDPIAAWEAFKLFAARPVVGDAEESVESDRNLLFESGRFSSKCRRPPREDAFVVALVRQFSIRDPHGGQDRLEQLYCWIELEESPEVVAIASDREGPIWSDDNGDVDAWAAAVEATEAFSVIRAGARARAVLIYQQAAD